MKRREIKAIINQGYLDKIKKQENARIISIKPNRFSALNNEKIY